MNHLPEEDLKTKLSPDKEVKVKDSLGERERERIGKLYHKQIHQILVISLSLPVLLLLVAPRTVVHGATSIS